MSMRRLVLVTLFAVILGVSGFLLGRSIVQVPAVGKTYSMARERVLDAGLALRSSTASPPLGTDAVSRQAPSPGSYLLRGMAVTVATRRPEEEVPVPNLLGRFADDAAAVLDANGLRGSQEYIPAGASDMTISYDPAPGSVTLRPEDENPPETPERSIIQASIIVSQTPSPGAIVPVGSHVTVRGAFAHPLASGESTPTTDPEVMKLHGLFFLRYGTEGAKPCTICHYPGTCVRRCHSSEAFVRLRDGEWH